MLFGSSKILFYRNLHITMKFTVCIVNDVLKIEFINASIYIIHNYYLKFISFMKKILEYKVLVLCVWIL